MAQEPLKVDVDGRSWEHNETPHGKPEETSMIVPDFGFMLDKRGHLRRRRYAEESPKY